MRLPLREKIRITTARTFLRPAVKQDYAEWANLRLESRDHLEPWEPIWPENALSREDWNRRMKAWREAWIMGRAYGFQIHLASSGELIGAVNLSNVRWGAAQMASLGYWLSVRHQGQGLMHEAAGAVCDWAFDYLELERLEAGALPDNTRSRKLLERLGFQEEGFARAYLRIAGKRRDHVLYALVRPHRAL